MENFQPILKQAVIHRETGSSLGYIKDSHGHYLAFPAQETKALEERAISYGRYDENYQRAPLFDAQNNIVTNFGFYISRESTENDLVMQIYTGAHCFSGLASHPDHKFSLMRESLLPSLKEHNTLGARAYAFLQAAINEEELKLLQQGKTGPIFISLPVSDKEKDEFDLFMLEDLVAASKNEGHSDHQLALTYIAEIEKQAAMPVEEIIQQYEQKALTAYEREILAEQQARSAAVADHQVAGLKKARQAKSSKGTGKGKKPQAPKQAVTPEIKELARKKFTAFKQQGRIKWEKALNLTKQLMQENPASTFLQVNITGSHITYHGNSDVAPTLRRPHGSKDKTLPAGKFNHFAEGLLKLMLKQEMLVSQPALSSSSSSSSSH